MPQGTDESAWQTTYEIWLAALANTYRELVGAVASFVPGLIGAALLILVGWLSAIAVRAAIVRFGTGLDRLFYAARDRIGQSQIELRWPISRVLAHTAYWLVIVFFLAAVSRLLALPGLVDIFGQVLHYLPLLLVWALAVFAVYVASGLVSSGTASAARSAGLSNADLLGRMARIVVLVFAGIIAASQIGIDVALLVNVVTITTAVLLGGAAIAFGIGAGGVAGNLIAAQQLRRNYRVGQRVAVDRFEGEILEITGSAVVLDTEQGRTMVPARLFNEQASILLDADG